MFKVMGLGLWRDRGALLLAFGLPSLVFAIFASIFSGATAGEMHLRIALAVESEDTVLRQFATSLTDIDNMTFSLLKGATGAQVLDQVRRGDYDTGLVVRGSLAHADKVPPFTIITEPTRQVAAASLQGLLRQRLSELAPEVLARQAASTGEALVGGFNETQRARLEASLKSLSEGAGEAGAGDTVFAWQSVYQDEPQLRGRSAIAYYAGATTILFLLLSAVHAGMVSLEERQNGIGDRLLLGAGGRARLLIGRFLFLVLLGFVQAVTIFVVARLGFGLPVESYVAKLVLVGLCAAAASAGLALLVLSLCTTAQQANTFSSFFVLIVSAVGGSMVPRFMMPEWLQAASLFTPNAWAIEGFYGALIRNDEWTDIAMRSAVLAAFGGLCLALAALPLRRISV